MGKMIRKIWTVLKPVERRRLTLLMCLDILMSIADVAFLALLLFIIHIYAEPNGHTHAAYMPQWLTDPRSLWPIFGFFLLFSVKNALSYLLYSAGSRLRYGVASRISHRNLLLYLEGEYSGFAYTDSAVHILKIAQQPIEFCQFVLAGLQMGVTESTLIGVTVIAVLLFNAKLFLLLLLLLLPPVIITGWLTKRKLHSARLFIKKDRDIMWQHLQESIASFVESNLYDKKEFFSDRYAGAQTILNRHLASVQALQGAPSRLAEVFAVFGLLALIAIGHFTGSPQSAGFVTLGAFLAAAYKVIPGIARLLNIAGQMKTYEFTVTGLLESEDRREGQQENAQCGKQDGWEERLETLAFRHIGFRYGQHRLLEDICIHIRAHDFLGIQGDSGKGKTTLFNILLGFTNEQHGEVWMNDRIADPSLRRKYWNRIAYVKQQPFVLHDTILVNITLGENGYDEARLQKAIALSGLDEVLKHMPGGVHARITEQGRNISGGQRQRIALARAFYKDADLILLDEPFSELDEASEEMLLQRFAALAREGKMVMMITHNKQSLSYCSATLSLDTPERAAHRDEADPFTRQEDQLWRYASNKG